MSVLVIFPYNVNKPKQNEMGSMRTRRALIVSLPHVKWFFGGTVGPFRCLLESALCDNAWIFVITQIHWKVTDLNQLFPTGFDKFVQVYPLSAQWIPSPPEVSAIKLRGMTTTVLVFEQPHTLFLWGNINGRGTLKSCYFCLFHCHIHL